MRTLFVIAALCLVVVYADEDKSRFDGFKKKVGDGIKKLKADSKNPGIFDGGVVSRGMKKAILTKFKSAGCGFKAYPQKKDKSISEEDNVSCNWKAIKVMKADDSAKSEDDLETKTCDMKDKIFGDRDGVKMNRTQMNKKLDSGMDIDVLVDQIESDGKISNDGEEIDLEGGDIKFSILVSNVTQCNKAAGDKMKISFKCEGRKGKKTLGAGDKKAKMAKKADKWDLGKNATLQISKKYQINGTFKNLADDDIKLANGVFTVKFECPDAEQTLAYDPSVSPGDDDDDDDFSSAGQAVATLWGLGLLVTMMEFLR